VIVGHRKAIEDAINTDFGHRSRYETAIMEVGGSPRARSI
jgi:coniferyl-aldehyde dehydrogenase